MTLSPEIFRTLEGTVACDDHGRPLVLHHGTFEIFDRFEKTRDIGFHFGSLRQAEARKGEKARELRLKEMPKWKVLNVALAVRNVIVYPDDPAQWTTWFAVAELARHFDPDFLRRIKDEGILDSRKAAFRLREEMLRRGVDAIVYRNLHESAAGATAEWSWLVLERNSIVHLPPSANGVLDVTVGSPTLDLPSSARDIPAVRTRDGIIRYSADVKTLASAVTQIAERMGGAITPRPETVKRVADVTFKLDFGGIEARMLASIGRVTVTLPPECREEAADWLDDSVTWSGPKRELRQVLTYEWHQGEKIRDFAVRLTREIERVRELAGDLVNAPSPAR